MRRVEPLPKPECHGHRDLHNKFRDDRSNGSRYARGQTGTYTHRQTHRQTDKQTDHNTPLPYRGRVMTPVCHLAYIRSTDDVSDHRRTTVVEYRRDITMAYKQRHSHAAESTVGLPPAASSPQSCADVIPYTERGCYSSFSLSSIPASAGVCTRGLELEVPTDRPTEQHKCVQPNLLFKCNPTLEHFAS